MTDSNDPIRQAFEKDQAEAKTQEAERDAVAWDFRVRDGEADIAFNQTRTHVNQAITLYWQSKHAVWTSVANLISILTGLIVITFLVFGIEHVVGYF